MLFKDHIPEKVLTNPNVQQFVEVLQGVHTYKQEVLFTGLKAFNPLVCTNKRRLVQLLAEYGFENFPVDAPLFVLQQTLLNADTILGLRGSKLGLEFLCSVLTRGSVVVNEADFFTEYACLLLNSRNNGTLVGDTGNLALGLVDNSGDISFPAELSIIVTTKYTNGTYAEWPIVRDYLKSIVPDYLGFSPQKIITWTFNSTTTFYNHSLLNTYFV